LMAPKRQAAVEAAELNKVKVAALPEDDDESEDDGDYAPPAQDEVRAHIPALKGSLSRGWFGIAWIAEAGEGECAPMGVQPLWC
jgi:hypothetical protein